MTTFVSIGSLTGSLHPSLSGVLTKRKTVLNCPLHGDYEAEGIYLGSILKTKQNARSAKKINGKQERQLKL